MGSMPISKTQSLAWRVPMSSYSGGGRSGGGGGGGTVTAPKASNVYKKLEEDYEAAKAEQQKRYEGGLAELAKVAGLFDSTYGAGMEQAALTGAKQSLIGRGLGGTTRPMAVSAGMKSQFKDLRIGKKAEALTRIAEYMRTSPLIYPGAGTLAGLASGGYNSPVGYGGAPIATAPTYTGATLSPNIPRITTSMGPTTAYNYSVGTPNFSLPS